MKTLCLIHGFGVDSRVFEAFANRLSKSYEIILIDLPGHGSTGIPFKDFKDSSEFLIDVINETTDSKVNLLGWSMGGQIALRAVSKAPELFENLVLLSSTPKFVASEDFPHGYNRAVFNKFYKGIKSDHKKAMEGFYELMEADLSITELMQTMIPSKNSLEKCMRAFEDDDQRYVLSKIEIPALIISGSEDKICNPEASKFMSEKIAGSKLKIINGAGHAIHLTREKELIDEIKAFIK